MEIVKGVMAGQAIKHKIGRVMKNWPPQVRVTKKDKARLGEILSEMSRKSAAARAAKNGHANGHANGVNGANGVTVAVATVEHPVSAPFPTGARLLNDEHLAFFKRVANDDRVPKDLRVEAFQYLLGA